MLTEPDRPSSRLGTRPGRWRPAFWWSMKQLFAYHMAVLLGERRWTGRATWPRARHRTEHAWPPGRAFAAATSPRRARVRTGRASQAASSDRLSRAVDASLATRNPTDRARSADTRRRHSRRSGQTRRVQRYAPHASRWDLDGKLGGARHASLNAGESRARRTIWSCVPFSATPSVANERSRRSLAAREMARGALRHLSSFG